ncbi:MAG: HlyD family efflux transporter periplasmic adaptor subunit, partial [Pseudomonadota bacterium]
SALRQRRAETLAAVAIAEARLQDAERSQSRQERLITGATVSEARLQEARTDAQVARAELDKALAQREALDGDLRAHPDYIAAVRALELARASHRLAQIDLRHASVRSPIAGTVLDAVVAPGEQPSTEGVVRVADLSAMVVRMEVHQSQIHRVALGHPVTVQGEALASALLGEVSGIGLEVMDQGLIGNDPVAANNARVFEVVATLDAPSAAIAARLVNLQVLATIEVGE